MLLFLYERPGTFGEQRPPLALTITPSAVTIWPAPEETVILDPGQVSTTRRVLATIRPAGDDGAIARPLSGGWRGEEDGPWHCPVGELPPGWLVARLSNTLGQRQRIFFRVDSGEADSLLAGRITEVTDEIEQVARLLNMEADPARHLSVDALGAALGGMR